MKERVLPGLLLGAFLAPAATSQRALLDALDADADVAVCRWFTAGFEEVALPGEGEVRGVARVGSRLWLARGEELVRWSAPGGKVEARRPRPDGLRDLAGGERFLYALTEDELLVLDPIAGVPVRTIAFSLPDERHLPHAVSVHDGVAHVLCERRLYPVDPRSGAVGRARVFPGRRFGMLEQLASGGAALLRLNAMGVGGAIFGEASPDDERWRLRWPQRCEELRAAVLDDERMFVCGRFVGGREWWAGVLRPGVAPEGPPPAAVTLRIVARDRPNGDVRWAIGPSGFDDEGALRRRLAALVANRKARGRPPLPVVIDVRAGVRVGDVRAAWDLAVSAGAAEVRCPPLEAFARRAGRRQPR
ncbi:MAG: hypothetical protein KAI24_25960 [Planctomycetes bacterium]|nr:hypothetical protein [Planctomycetota bacterium]